jgi:hypothetical protein
MRTQLKALFIVGSLVVYASSIIPQSAYAKQPPPTKKCYKKVELVAKKRAGLPTGRTDGSSRVITLPTIGTA